MIEKNQCVKSLSDYLRFLPDINEKIQSQWFYRGQSDVSYDLIPSVFRSKHRRREHDYYMKALTSCPDDFDSSMSHADILVKMQHYGIPTRLLDVTQNPLVALFFACLENNNGKDGVVFCIKPREWESTNRYEDFSLPIKSFDSDTMTILSSLPCLSCAEQNRLMKHVAEIDDRILSEHTNIKTVEETMTIRNKLFANNPIAQKLLHEIRKEKPYFTANIDIDDLKSNIFYIPRMMNPRVAQQSGAFLVFGAGESMIKADKLPLYAENQAHPIGSYRIRISGRCKQRILQQLEAFGVSYERLFPDLASLAEGIRKGNVKFF